MNYQEFIATKRKKVVESGFEPKKLNDHLFDFQEYIVRRALKCGRFAIFSDTGTGKTIMQLEWAHQVLLNTGKPVLILAPLAVSGQTIREGAKFGIKIWKVNHDNILRPDGIDDHVFPRIYITNYQQLDNITELIPFLSGVVLDESSILKNFGGVYKDKIIKFFEDTPYKLACTATPSPNDCVELGNHAEFLGAMNYNEMLAMYFINDMEKSNTWRLKEHATDHFWEFVSSWACMMMKPEDIGFNAKGFDLPKLTMNEIQVTTETPQGMLFGGLAVNATEYNAGLRESEDLRVIEVVKIVRSIGKEQVIIWTKQNQEADRIFSDLTKLGYECRNVKGSDSDIKKETDLLGFAENNFQILITKSKIAQFGLNYQNCHYQIFASVDFSFESTYQSIRRSYRFGQDKEVTVWLITTDRMINVLQSQKEKENQFLNMQISMTNAINKFNQNITSEFTDITEVKEPDYWLMRGDCVQMIRLVPDHSVHLSVFSPPFPQLYTYSDHIEDMGNSSDFDEFMTQFKYLVAELKRVMLPGRVVGVHCMDLPIQKGKEGYIGLRDFSGLLIDAFQAEGFIYHSRVTIWKDPVIEMQRTKALGLLHKQIKKDSVMCRVGLPDYILAFRAPGENIIPIINQDTDSQGLNYIPVDYWQKIASPVWWDIDYGNTLNYREGKGEKDEKHICPLQLPTIERVILLWSNEGETVLSPFGGIGSEGYQALKMKRKSISIELKHSYFSVNCKNHRNAVENRNQLQMF